MTRYGTTGRKHQFRVHYYRSRGVVHVGGVVLEGGLTQTLSHSLIKSIWRTTELGQDGRAGSGESGF
jgi:hypothetical protein